jgi:hypothetical protein
MLEPPSPKNLYAAALRGGTVLNAAKTVLDHTEKLQAGRGPGKTLIDVSKLSTPLLRMLRAELAQIQRREAEAMGKVPSPPPTPVPEGPSANDRPAN